MKRIEKIATDIKSKKYKWSPVRRLYVEKPKLLKPGEKPKQRPLGIPSFEDKIVKEAIRIILESIYEPLFEKEECNFGFRPNKSCHNAITHLIYNGTGSNIAIEGEIKGAYDNVNHDILINILKKNINDPHFLKFLKAGFKSGILEQVKYIDTITGVPQGGIASPILFNIYLHEFDLFIKNDLQEFINNKNKEQNREYKPKSIRYNKIYNEYAKVKNKLTRLNKKQNKPFIELTEKEKEKKINLIKEIKYYDLMKANTPSIKRSKKAIKISYTRYADDFIILSNCKKDIAIEIKNKISSFLKEKLNLLLSEEKTLITNIKVNFAKFLGFSIKTYNKRKISYVNGRLTKTAGWNVLIDVDIERVLNSLKLKGFSNLKNKPIAKNPWTVLKPEEIINRYNYILRGIGNYYFPMLDRLTTIDRVFYILKFSAISTFAKKYKSKITKILKKKKKYGDPLTVTITEKYREKEINKTITLLNYRKVKEFNENKKMNFKTYKNFNSNINSDLFQPMRTINWRTYKNLENVCAICGTNENVEQHHIKHIRKGKVTGFAQIMKQLNRRMIPLCKTHHIEVEHGKYDKIKLSDLIHLERYLS